MPPVLRSWDSISWPKSACASGSVNSRPAQCSFAQATNARSGFMPGSASETASSRARELVPSTRAPCGVRPLSTTVVVERPHRNRAKFRLAGGHRGGLQDRPCSLVRSLRLTISIQNGRGTRKVTNPRIACRRMRLIKCLEPEFRVRQTSGLQFSVPRARQSASIARRRDRRPGSNCRRASLSVHLRERPA